MPFSVFNENIIQKEDSKYPMFIVALLDNCLVCQNNDSSTLNFTFCAKAVISCFYSSLIYLSVIAKKKKIVR